MSSTGSRDFSALSEAQIRARRLETRQVDASGLLQSPAPRPMADLLDAIAQAAEAATGERSFLPRPATGR